MNLFVADPHWGWWIILYFFLGGVAAGAYFMAALIDLVGSVRDRELARFGYWLAFPLIVVCGVFLIVDLNRPERFWHMLVRSEVVHEALAAGWPLSADGWGLMGEAPLMKYWSPMSIGSWAITIFGLCSFLSFLGSLQREGRWAWLLRWSWFARGLQLVGCLVGFFVASYTGALLTATSQPVWSASTWIAPLFLTSAASTGIAALILLARWKRTVPAEALDRLERADLWALGLELGVFVVFLASLGALVWPVWGTWAGKLLIAGTLLAGLLAPLAIHLRLGGVGRRSVLVAATLALVGGFLLRYGIVMTPPELLAQGPAALVGFSPEAGRVRGERGADPNNKRSTVHPRSKVYLEE
jgi:formate-dependent nitrite reductase membrane component NrfD